MPGFSNDGKNVMLDSLAGVAVFVSLHTGDPGGTGAAEVSGGTYARQGVTWGASSGGEISASNQPEFDVPGSTTVSHFGLWSANTAGTFYGGVALSASETFSSNGQYTLTSITANLNAA